MVKLGQMEKNTFEALRDEIIGGSVKDVHLLKGLDRKLLERVRRGEDVLAEPAQPSDAKGGTEEVPSAAHDVNVDDELERLEATEFEPVKKQENVKKGEMAPPPPPVAGRKRNRDEILKELKASRQAAAEAEKLARPPSLGPRFQRVGENKATSRVEMDEKGREVLITVDEQGRVKRKIKKPKIEDSGNQNGLLMLDKDVKPLGMDVTSLAVDTATEDQDEGDIFEGVGADYDPIGTDEEDDSDSDDSAALTTPTLPLKSPNPKNQEKVSPHSPFKQSQSQNQTDSSQSQAPSKLTAGPRNYFGEDEQSDSTGAGSANLSRALDDPTLLAAIKKASSLRPLSGESQSSTDEQEAAKLARRERMLDAHDRDAEDMDLGFGSSRFEDEEDSGDRKIKLSVWGSTGETGENGHGSNKSKRKRGSKKKKGDKESVADVLNVLERRKAENR